MKNNPSLTEMKAGLMQGILTKYRCSADDNDACTNRS